MDERLKDSKSSKRSSDDAKDIVAHRGIAKNEERSCSEPPNLASTSKRSRLTTIQEKIIDESSDCELSKSNNHLNESDLDLEVDGSTSTTLMQSTPTPSLIACCTARRINSETNLNDASRRLSGFLGNKNKRFCSSTSELNFSSHLDTRKSLFSPKNNALSRQSFNSSLYGSNLSLNSSNSRLFVTQSPFYDGKTMFGGASAYNKREITTQKFMRVPVPMRPTSSSSLMNESKSNQDLPESNATKRILEIMSDFKGPLKEARSMGSNISSFLNSSMLAAQNKKRFSEEDLIRERNLSLRNPLNSVSASKLDSSQEVFNSYSAASPTIPTMSQLLRMKKLQSNTEKVREIATRSESFLNKNTEYKLPNVNEKIEVKGSSSSSSSLMKMKNNIVRNLIRVDNNKKEDEPPQAVNLPNIQLPQLKNIPKFDVQIPTPVQKKVEVPAPVTIQKKAEVVVQVQKPVEKKIETSHETKIDKYQFSKPLSMKNMEDFDVKRICFIFSKPTDVSTIKTPSKSFVSEVKENQLSMDEEDSPVIDLCCDNESDEIKETKSLQANGIVETQKKGDDLFASLVQKQKSQKWECDACMTRNEETSMKCACCETPKPGSAPVAAAKPAISSSFSFGMPANNTKPIAPADDLFKNIAAKQKSQNWECGDCLTQNTAAQSKCGCCQASNPNSSTMPSNSQPAVKDDKPLDDEFKKIVSKQQSAKWECSTCMTRNDDSSSKCVCCEGPKPNAVSSATPFSFGSFGSASKVTLPPPSEVKFSFGMTKSVVELPPPTEVKFSFGMTNNKENDVKSVSSTPSLDSSTNSTQKSQETPEIINKPSEPVSTPVFGGFSFSSNSKLGENISNAAPASLLPPATLQKSSLQLNAKTEIPSKSNDNSLLENSSKTSTTFAFNSGTTENSASLAFPKSDNAGIGMFKTSSTINFGVNESSSQSIANNNNNSLFQPKDDKPLTTGFSFGSNSASSMFTFGGNKLSTPADSKPASTPVFGASPSFSSLASNNNTSSIINNNNNNNVSQENLFVFGGQTQKRPFDSSFPSADTADAQNNFNAPNEIKSTFNLAPKAAPVQGFNFSANLNNVITKDPKNIFQFGQTSGPIKLTTTMNPSDVSQLNAVPNIEIPSIINPLGSFKATNSSANARKILRARRTVTRR